MRILVWGLGYVGTVSAACLADLGHEVIGIDPNTTKVEAINSGKTAMKEPGLDALVQKAVAAGRLRAVEHGTDVVPGSDVSLICVGTPSAADGSPVLTYVRSVAKDLGEGLAKTNDYHLVALRSTVFPGTTRKVLVPLLEEHSGKTAGEDFGAVMNPEFLREATAVQDFHEPAYTVIGQYDERSGEVMAQMYEGIDAPDFHVALEEAELIKMSNNAFHALKIGFANEIGRFCHSLGIDAHTVMEMVCADTKLNISPVYMRPGFAFGGSCLPKDLRSLSHHARRLDVSVPILDSVIPSNVSHINTVRRAVHATGKRRVGILGLSFKADTDDLRESPAIELIRQLWLDDMDVVVLDPDVDPKVMLGSNLAYLERQLPQLYQILTDDAHAFAEACDVVVMTKRHAAFEPILSGLAEDVPVIDAATFPARPKRNLVAA